MRPVSSDRPNILLITTDQHRWDWLGCHGTPGVETPNLDALAATGLRVTGHVTNSSICAAARIGLATGVLPIRQGALDNHAVLDPAMPTYYQALRDAGYRVGCVGKLDLNKPEQYNGRRGDRPDLFGWGFTHPVEIEGKMHAGMSQDREPFGPYGYWLRDQGLWDAFLDDYHARLGEIIERMYGDDDAEPSTATGWIRDSVLPSDAFADHFIGEQARTWLTETPQDFPWHLFVSFVGPHDPFDPPTEWADRFRDAPMPEPARGDGIGKPQRARKRRDRYHPDLAMTARRQYTASLAFIDDQIGQLLATLDATGQRDDTLVIFTADHGELLGDHGMYQKNFAYEASMRIPLIVSGLGTARGVSDTLTELVDVTATIADYADAPMAGLDGRTLRPLLEDPSAGMRSFVTCCETQYRSIRTPDWKYIHNVAAAEPGATDTHELYDLRTDPDELVNLIDEAPETADTLLTKLTATIGAERLT